MAWQCVGLHSFGTETSKAVSPLCQQNLMLLVVGTAADVALDLGNPSGTFWTAALADPTYGSTAAIALQTLQSYDKAAAFAIPPGGNFVCYRARVVNASSTGDYAIGSWTNKIPNFAFAAGDGPGSTNVILSWGMPQGFQVQTFDSGL